MAAPSSKELLVLSQFREMIADLELPPEKSTDLKLLAWLRARDLDLVKANDMLRASLQWRQENNIENLPNWTAPANYKNDFYFEIVGKDSGGRPIVIAPIGEYDARSTITKSEEDKLNFIRYIDQSIENVVSAMKDSPTGKEVTQFVGIFDFANLPMKQLTSYTCVETYMEIVKRFENNYPEILHSVYIVNASRIFSTLFAIVKPLLTMRTLSKIQIYSSPKKWQPVLLMNLPMDQLPVEMGGCRRGARRVSIGNIPHEDLGLKEGIDYVKVMIGAGKKLELEYQVKHINTKINWKFKTLNHNIGFSINYNRKEDVLPERRYESQNAEAIGSVICDKVGEYFLVFDNTYSRMRSKTLEYMVEIQDPEEALIENDGEE